MTTVPSLRPAASNCSQLAALGDAAGLAAADAAGLASAEAAGFAEAPAEAAADAAGLAEAALAATLAGAADAGLAAAVEAGAAGDGAAAPPQLASSSAVRTNTVRRSVLIDTSPSVGTRAPRAE